MKKNLFLAFLIFLVACLAYIPLAATGVQESDGAEIAYQALNSGVLHPPGFPLYSLVSIYLVKIFPNNPYHTLAIFSAVCQALAGSFLFFTAKIFLKSSWVSIAIACSWLFFPATFRSATDCEVFALNNLLVIISCFCALKILHQQSKLVLYLGLFTGLSWSNHQMSIFFAPLIFLAVYSTKSWTQSIKFAWGLILGLSPHLYLVSKIYLPDPNLFFPLANFKELFNYLTRSVYGTFNLKYGLESEDISYFWHFITLVIYYAPLALISSFVLIIRFKKYKLIAIGLLLSVAANLWFASQLIFPNQIQIHGELLMRFYPGILLALLLSLPILVKELLSRRSEYWIMFFLIIVPVCWNLPMKIGTADARHDRLAEVEIKMILDELPTKAIYISNLDRQTMGIPYYQQVLKNPKGIEVVIQESIQNPEYKRILSKRIFDEKDPQFYDFPSFLELALSRGKEVFILSGKIPEQFAVLPYKHTWQIGNANTIAQVPDLTANLLTNCANLPVKFLNVSEHRHNSQLIVQGAFLSGWRWLAEHPLHFPEKKLAKTIIRLYKEKKYSEVQDLCQKLLTSDKSA